MAEGKLKSDDPRVQVQRQAEMRTMLHFQIEMQNAAMKVDGYDYTLIKKKGTITLTSFRKENSTMRITLSTGGKIEKASDKAKIKVNDFRPDDWDDQSYMRPNNHSDVTWEFTLEPGQSKTLTYTLSSYIR